MNMFDCSAMNLMYISQGNLLRNVTQGILDFGKSLPQLLGKNVNVIVNLMRVSLLRNWKHEEDLKDMLCQI